MADLEALKADEDRIRSLGLPSLPTTFLAAIVLRSREFYADAISTLERVSSQTQEPAVFRTLGETYLATGLTRLAEQRYVTALTLSEKSADVDGAAQCADVLGEIYASLGNTPEALKRWTAAASAYDRIGSTANVARVNARIAAARASRKDAP
jgi:predicted negative regulator of RcsB-dependent stress response